MSTLFNGLVLFHVELTNGKWIHLSHLVLFVWSTSK